MIEGGHGPLRNILDNYTLQHANKFLREVDKSRLRQRMTHIYDVRLAGATEKSFKEVMAKLRAQQRVMDKVEGQAAQREEMLAMRPDEVAAFQNQSRFTTLNDMPTNERKAMEAEIEQMWSSVPRGGKAWARAQHYLRGGAKEDFRWQG